MEEFLPIIPSNPGLKRDEDQHQNMQDQDMDMGNQDTDTGPLGLGEAGRKRDTMGPGSEGIRIQETTIVTWRYCDKDVGIQDTDMGDWDLDARELRLKQVTGTRTGACRDTGDQDQQRDTDQNTGAGAWGDGDGDSGGLDQHLENQDTGHQDRDMRNWDRDTEALEVQRHWFL